MTFRLYGADKKSSKTNNRFIKVHQCRKTRLFTATLVIELHIFPRRFSMVKNVAIMRGDTFYHVASCYYRQSVGQSYLHTCFLIINLLLHKILFLSQYRA